LTILGFKLKSSHLTLVLYCLTHTCNLNFSCYPPIPTSVW
jgi:hypothetical protein